MKTRFNSLGILVSAVLVINLIIGYHVHRRRSAASGQGNQLQLCDTILEAFHDVRKYHVNGEGITDEMLLTDALKGITQKFNDFSDYYEPSVHAEVEEMNHGEIGGIGIYAGNLKDAILVIETIPDTPAAKAGLESGDRITMVAGQAVKDIGPEKSLKLFRKTTGSTVDIVYERKGIPEPQAATLQLAKIPIATVTDAHVIKNTTVGFVRVSQFLQNTPKAFEKALKENFDDDKTTALIIDLRHNPGGLVWAAVQMCSMFLPPDTLIVSVEGRGFKNAEKSSALGYHFPKDKPVIFLVDEGTASAAEIMAGCLQTHQRATLVGNKTYGKGSVQQIMDLENGGAIKLTIAHYYLQPDSVKDRKKIHKNGIVPDLQVTFSKQDIEKQKEFDQEWEKISKDESLSEEERFWMIHKFWKKSEEFDPFINRALQFLQER